MRAALRRSQEQPSITDAACRQRGSVANPQAAIPQEEDKGSNLFGVVASRTTAVVGVEMVASMKQLRHLFLGEGNLLRLLHNGRDQLQRWIHRQSPAAGTEAKEIPKLLQFLFRGEITIGPGAAEIAQQIEVDLFHITQAAVRSESRQLAREVAVLVNGGRSELA